jgi:general L-amino acid transport system substrate-binding protein
VGSYKDIYDNNFGANSPLKLPRGPNELWTRGGMIYGYPMK